MTRSSAIETLEQDGTITAEQADAHLAELEAAYEFRVTWDAEEVTPTVEAVSVMRPLRSLRRAVATLVAVAVLAVGLAPATASAHSLTSSTVAVTVAEDSVSATVSVVAETLVQATGANTAAQFEAYLAKHLSAEGADGNA